MVIPLSFWSVSWLKLVCINNNSFLITNKISFADIAIFPFVRQFANVNLESFMKGDFKKTIDWYLRMQKEKIFFRAMEKPKIIS